jgi:hypothetical protein
MYNDAVLEQLAGLLGAPAILAFCKIEEARLKRNHVQGD